MRASSDRSSGSFRMNLSSSNAATIGKHMAERCISTVGNGNVANFIALVALAEEAESSRASSDEPLILKSFSPTYLFNLVHFSPELSPQTLLEKLKTAMSARKELERMERNMCKDYFKQLVTSGMFCAGGIDKETGSIVFWINSREYHRGCWNISSGTPRANAWCRAYLFAIETAQRMGHQTPGRRCIQYVDDSERRALDFNIACSGQMFGLMAKLFPCRNERVLLFGHNILVSATMSLLRSIFGDRMGNIEFVCRKSSVRDLVEDASDIPAFFSDIQGQGKVYSAEDRRCVWCYERLASDAQYSTLATADVHNAGPWEYPEFDYSTTTQAPPGSTNASGKKSVHSVLGNPASRLLVRPFSKDDESDDEW